MAKAKTTKLVVDETEVAVGEREVTVCRRRGDRRSGGKAATDTAAKDEMLEADSSDDMDDETEDGQPPKKVQRRRQIDPTTCERDYTDDEIEFMHALDAYKRSSGRMFPTCSEILEVVRGLGYTKAIHREEMELMAAEADGEADAAAGDAEVVDEDSELVESL